MIIQRTADEVIFRLSGKMSIDELQDMADLLTHRTLTATSKATQKEVDALVKEVKKGRWESTKAKLGL
ncbi:MAG: hypothetical protein K9J06_11185 [Flavobacteriales bacterium]|nr:hypothetical protein [Flavobacteriales bacterium]